MTYEPFIGLRYLMSKRRSRVLSVITLISVAGVTLGVTAMIVVLSVMGGFKKDLKQKILGTKAHIVVQSEDGDPMESIEPVMKAAEEMPSITGASPFVEAEVMVSSPTNLNGLLLRGIRPESFQRVSQVPENVQQGKLAYLEDTEAAIPEGSPGSLLDQIEKTEKEIEETEKQIEEATSDGAKDSEENAGGMPSIVPDEKSADEGDKKEESDTDRTTLPGLLIGKELAKSLQVRVGDEVNVVTPEGDMGPTGPMPRSRPFRIVGIFYTGMYEYDANYGYTLLSDANAFLDQQGVNGVEMKTADVQRAIEIADRLDARLAEMTDYGYDVLDWKELNQSLFYALELEKIAMFVVLTFIILVASFSIIAMLIMMVLEKSRDISVLKSMGMTDGGVMRIFMLQGVVIGAVGAAAGLVLGLGICWGLIEFGFPLDTEVYYISTLPVEIDPWEVTSVVVCTIVISLLATLYPAKKAAELRPVEGLRYE
jgi:lipoprotein-releasing system permease protein